jgi:hypothetical protein
MVNLAWRWLIMLALVVSGVGKRQAWARGAPPSLSIAIGAKNRARILVGRRGIWEIIALRTEAYARVMPSISMD